MTEQNKNGTKQDTTKTKTFNFGDKVPGSDASYDVEYVYPDFSEDNTYVIPQHILSGEVSMRTFPKKGEEGTYNRLGLRMLSKSTEAIPMELIVPYTVYGGMVECFNEYRDKLTGYKVKKTGVGQQTRYTVLPVL